MGYFDDKDKKHDFGTVFGPDGPIVGIGGGLHGPDGAFQQEIGNGFFGSDGQMAFDNGPGNGMFLGGRSFGGMVTEVGNMFYGPDGRTYSLIGGSLYCSDGRSWHGLNGPRDAKRIIAMDY